MDKLVLKFGDAVLAEKFVGDSGLAIGRSPDNGMVIDNPAVSHRHAQVSLQPSGRLMLEDLGSMNGTSVNGQRIGKVTLKPGDCVTIGKHKLYVEETHEMDGLSMWKPPARPAAPKVDETVILGTKDRRELLKKLAADGESAQPAPNRMKMPVLAVLKGKTNESQYLLMDKLTVIGKSTLATVQLRGWFAPKAAAQINRREDGSFYLGAAGKVPSVNGHRAEHPTKLLPGDIIDVAGIRMEFSYND